MQYTPIIACKNAYLRVVDIDIVFGNNYLPLPIMKSNHQFPDQMYNDGRGNIESTDQN